MTDWNVQVFTQDGQVKNVKVYDYNYPSDAERAALSQTGGAKVIWSSPFCDTLGSDNEPTTQSSGGGFYVDMRPSDFDYSTKEGLIGGFICATLLPTIILLLIHPIPAILFNLALARWWFTD